MRPRFDPDLEQRAALRARLARARRPAGAAAILEAGLGRSLDAVAVRCHVVRAHPDRFVVRVELHSRRGTERSYALKGYADEHGARVWARARALAGQHRTADGELCLPCGYVAAARVLVFPWVAGPPLPATPVARRELLLRRAARCAAALHALDPAPQGEAPTPAHWLVEGAGLAAADPWRAHLVELLPLLDPAPAATVHGDLNDQQFLVAGERLVLLDLDALGCADPAYDAGRLLASVEQRAVLDGTPPEQAARWLAVLQDAYLDAIPPGRVSLKNIAFYRALALAEGVASLAHRQVAESVVHQLADRVRAALEHVQAPLAGVGVVA